MHKIKIVLIICTMMTFLGLALNGEARRTNIVDVTKLGDNVKDIKLVFLVDAYKSTKGKIDVPQGWPHVPLQPVFKNIEVWEYPVHLRGIYRDQLGVKSLKERINYAGTCRDFISNKATLQYYRQHVKKMRFLKGKEVLVRLICVAGENKNNVYRITGGSINAMVYFSKSGYWSGRYMTRPLTSPEIQLLENIDFERKFDAIGRHPLPATQ